MADQLPTDGASSTPTSPCQGTATPPTSPPAVAASKVSSRRPSEMDAEMIDSCQLRVASLVGHKTTTVRYSDVADTDMTLLTGTLYLVEREEYENLNLRFFKSTIRALESDVPACYADSTHPWVLLHPNYGKSWVHESWLIYDFADAGLTIGQDFVAITFERSSFDATERFSPIGAYTLNGSFTPNDAHASHTILALPVFSDTSGLDPAKVVLDNSSGLKHYTPLGGKRQRKVNSFALPLVKEYSPRPVSAQTMRYIHLIAKQLNYPPGSSNSLTPKRTWLKSEASLSSIIDPRTGALKPSGELYGLRGNHAIFRARAWDRLCSYEERRQSSNLPAYWQPVFEERRIAMAAPSIEEVTLEEGGEEVTKRDSCVSVSPEHHVIHAERGIAEIETLTARQTTQ